MTGRLADYRRWHHLQVATRDIDPTYPVLHRLAAQHDDDHRAWLVVLHVAYYHIGSALRVFSEVQSATMPTRKHLALPCGTERRGHRDPRKLSHHFVALLDKCDQYGGPHAWITAGGRDWPALTAHLADVHGNGRWAAYKLGELAQKVLGVPTTITDAGHAHSSGPRKGLALLADIPAGNSAGDVARLDNLTRRVAELLREPDIGHVETSLCDYHSLAAGRYYLGHDIDAMQTQLDAVPSDQTHDAYRARVAELPHHYLGEIGGWHGVDSGRKGIYARRGEIVERRPPTHLPRR